MENGGVYCKAWQSNIPGALGQPVQRKKRMELELQIRISSSSISVASEEGMNEKLLRSPSNRYHPQSINGSVLPTVALACSKNPQEFRYLGKRVDAAEKNRQENVRSSVGEAPFGVVFDDQLGWLCLILIIP